MAKTLAPLLSWGASGKIADTQVYASWKGRQYARRFVVPANPDTAGQQLTRNTFKFLTRLWQFLPAGAIGAWTLYANNSRFTDRNGWIKLNNGPLRTETDLDAITLSPSAGSGIVASAIVVTPGATQLSVALTAPSLPTGWTIVKAWAMAVRSVNPQTSDIYDVTAGEDATSPYTIVLTGLDTGQTYVVGGWFEYLKPDGSTAYGVALQTTGVPT